MSREEFIYQLLNGDVGLRDLGLEALHRSNAMDDPTERCFALLIWGTEAPQLPGGISTRDLIIWVYDTPGYYGAIDDILSRIRQIMLNVVGGEVAQVQWLGDSDDLFDDKYSRAVRTGTYTVH